MSRRKLVVCTALSAALCFLMPTSDSIWIDEAQTAAYVAQPSLAAWAGRLMNDRFSEALMPLGMFVAWAVGKVFGSLEWQLRAPNIIWSLVSVLSFAHLGRLWRTPWAPLLFAVQPFVWFYANEARPYSLQIACASVLMAGMMTMICRRDLSLGWLAATSAAGCALVGASLFGVLTTAPALTILLYILWKQRRPFPRGSWLILGLTVLLCAACGIYYLGALDRGGQGAKLWTVSASNLAFAAYEWLGFTGFGPGRDELRELARAGHMRTLLYLSVMGPIALLAGVYLVLVAALARQWSNVPRTQGYAILGVLVAACLSTIVLAVAAGFPFWGRHLAPAFPFFCALLIVASKEVIHRGGIGKTVAYGLLGTLLASSLLLRFHPRHRKDDYRAAAAFVREPLARGKSVWWSADPQGARYYGLAVAPPNAPARGAVNDLSTAPDLAIATAPQPDYLVISKPDIFDSRGALASYIRDQPFEVVARLKAFTVWERARPQP